METVKFAVLTFIAIASCLAVWIPVDKDGSHVHATRDGAHDFCQSYGMELAVINEVEARALKEAYIGPPQRGYPKIYSRYRRSQADGHFRDPATGRQFPHKWETTKAEDCVVYEVNHNGPGTGFHRHDCDTELRFLCAFYTDKAHTGVNRFPYPVCSPNLPHLECLAVSSPRSQEQAETHCNSLMTSMVKGKEKLRGFLPDFKIPGYNSRQMNYRSWAATWTSVKRQSCAGTRGPDYIPYRTWLDRHNRTLGWPGSDGLVDTGFWDPEEPNIAGTEPDECCATISNSGHQDRKCDQLKTFYCVFDHSEK